jgi:hypothetical protein
VPFEGVAPRARILSVKVNDAETGNSATTGKLEHAGPGDHRRGHAGGAGHQRLGADSEHSRAEQGGEIRAEPGRRHRGGRGE